MPTEVSSQSATPSPGNGQVVPWERVDRFVGQLAHDIRNGLNACELQLTFLGEISSDPEAAEEIKQLRATLAGITRQLQKLRVATGNVSAHLLEYPAADLFEDLQERFARLRPELAGQVRWEISFDASTLVRVDPELMLGACLELLNNALQFAEQDTPIICRAHEGAGLVTAEIENTLSEAPADPPENWGQTPLSSTRRGAYGLGLFHARRSLAAQGGSLDFRHSSETNTLTATIVLTAVASPALP